MNRAKKAVAKAVEKDDQKRLKMIFESNYPVDTPLNRIKQTPTMLYAQWLNCEGIQFMVQCGSDINATDSMGRTMLHYLV